MPQQSHNGVSKEASCPGNPETDSLGYQSLFVHSICRPLHHHRSWAMAGNEGGDGGSAEKWPLWMSNGWIWETHPACREHKLQESIYHSRIAAVKKAMFQWLFTTSLQWCALVFCTLKPHSTTSQTQSLIGTKQCSEQEEIWCNFIPPLSPAQKKEQKRRETIDKLTSIKILMC